MPKKIVLCSWLMCLLLIACAGDGVQKLPLTTAAGDNTSSSPSSDDLRSRDRAAVRFVHAIPGASLVDLSANTNKIISGAAYKSVSPYQEVPGGRTAFFLRPSGIDTVKAITEGSANLSKGERSTIIAVAGEENPSLLVSEDRLRAPGDGKVLFRAVHTALLAGKIDIFAATRSEPIMKGLTLKQISDYSEIEPLTGVLEVRPTGDNAALLKLPDVSLRANGVYTLIITGRAKGTQDVEGILIEDRWR